VEEELKCSGEMAHRYPLNSTLCIITFSLENNSKSLPTCYDYFFLSFLSQIEINKNCMNILNMEESYKRATTI
jgi:hypothetical protein